MSPRLKPVDRIPEWDGDTPDCIRDCYGFSWENGVVSWRVTCFKCGINFMQDVMVKALLQHIGKCRAVPRFYK